MKKIIGGEFSIAPYLIDKADYTNKPDYSEKADYTDKSEGVVFSSGRCAFYAILEDVRQSHQKGNTILLPDYLCDSITKTVKAAQWQYSFYHIKEDLSVDMTSVNVTENVGAMLLINYFGIMDCKETIKLLRDKHTSLIIIEDDVQAYFNCKISSADYSFTSLRKWFPCPDGAVVYNNLSGKFLYGNYPEKNEWSQYKLAGNVLKQASDYLDEGIILSLLENGEQKLENNYLCNCSEISRIILESLDLDEIEQKRRSNARLLHNELERLNICHKYDEEAIPNFIPIFIPGRDELRKCFFENDIFVPKHWHHVSAELNGINTIYDMELSLICDHRYEADDMYRQLSIIEDYLKTI